MFLNTFLLIKDLWVSWESLHPALPAAKLLHHGPAVHYDEVSGKWVLLLLLTRVEITATCVAQHRSEIFLSKTLPTPFSFPPLLLPHSIQFIKSMEGTISGHIIIQGCH